MLDNILALCIQVEAFIVHQKANAELQWEQMELWHRQLAFHRWVNVQSSFRLYVQELPRRSQFPHSYTLMADSPACSSSNPTQKCLKHFSRNARLRWCFFEFEDRTGSEEIIPSFAAIHFGSLDIQLISCGALTLHGEHGEAADCLRTEGNVN